MQLQRPSGKPDERGFTLVEVLVVMIIIGVLAAIAIPVFLNQRKKAHDSAAKADVSTIGKEIATYYVNRTGTPTVTRVSGRYRVAGVDVGASSANVVVFNQFFASDSSWCVTVRNSKGNKAVAGYKYSAAGGLAQGACAAATG